MRNILDAIQSIIEDANSCQNIQAQSHSGTRINAVGDALEDFIRDAFAGCIGRDQRFRNHAKNQTFSYMGGATTPPDAMLRGGDAIEVKKIETRETTQLQLNSSYPKNKFFSSYRKISAKCKNCENWTCKDIIYVIGVVPDNNISELFFTYGDLYCDEKSVYESVENVITDGLRTLPNVRLSDTKELGRVNGADHLGISDLRIRGMWLIKNPIVLFDYLTNEIGNPSFKLVALIPCAKYNSFENVQDFEEFSNRNNVRISEEDIPDPQNPANLIKSKLILYYE